MSTRTLTLAALVGLVACSAPSAPSAPTAPAGSEAPVRAAQDHHHPAALAWQTAHAVQAALARPALVPPDGQPFQRVGLRLDGAPPTLVAQVQRGDRWDPAPVEVTWSEGDLHVARVVLDAPATALRLFGGQGLTAAAVEFYPDRGEPERPLARSLPKAQAGLEVLEQRLAPDDLVVMREAWGARDPERICNDVVAPYRMTVHHTASPDSDGADPAARLRQIQAFHIDSRGWCDIGYHFVISQSGLVFEARRGEDRPAAHVANQNTGNIGFSFIGNYMEQQVPDVQIEAAARIMGWALRTHTGVQATREFIKGHREWPGQNTQCPGDNLFPRLEEIIAKAVGDTPPPVMDGAVSFEARWLSSPPDRDGAGLPDAFEGEAMEAVAVICNGTDGPIRNVRLGFTVGAGLVATDYTIETDAPGFDGATFVVNDADAAPENPPKDGLAGSGELVMYAFAAGETKRVRVSLEPDVYGEPARRALRLWVTNVDGVYQHADFGARPELNTQDGLLRNELALDVIHPAAWTWDGPATREGWDPCGDVPTPSWFAEGDGLIGLGGAVGPCALSAPWAAVDAGRFDALAVSVRATDAARDVRVDWAAAGADFSADHGLVFRVPGDGQWRVWRLPVGGAPGWTGTIGRLKLTGAVGFPEGAPAEAGYAQFDAVWGQNTTDRSSAVEALPYAGEAPEIIEDAGPPPPEPDQGTPSTPRLDGGTPRPDSGPVDLNPTDGTTGGEGCAAAPGAPGGLGWALGLLGLVAVRRRRRA